MHRDQRSRRRRSHADHRRWTDRRLGDRVPARRQSPRHAERRHDAGRQARRRGLCAAGRVPGVKSVAAQGLHDVVLDPDFAKNRTLYFTYFAPPKGEAPAAWPIEFFYEGVWTKPFAERRTMQLGAERVARAD